MEKLEEILAMWAKQIEQVLTESEQMRREADDIGPSAELTYWKSRMAKFNKWVTRLITIQWSLAVRSRKLFSRESQFSGLAA